MYVNKYVTRDRYEHACVHLWRFSGVPGFFLMFCAL